MPNDFDVFLSHNSRDKPAVEEIAARLRDRGLRVWLDKDELRPGLPWQEGLEAGVRASRSVAVFVGKDGLGPWQNPEMRAFLARAGREGIPVIPVLLPGCPESPQLNVFLEAMTWVDLHDGLTDDGLGRLVWGITGTKSEGARAVPAAAPGTGERPGRFSLLKTSRPWWSWGIALSLLGVLLTLAVWLWSRSPEPPPPPRKPADQNVQVKINLKKPESLIRGVVVDESGQELANVPVSVQEGPPGNAITGPHGRFEFKLPVPPETQIRMHAEHEGLVGENFCFTGRGICPITLVRP